MGEHTKTPWMASESNWGQFSIGPAHNVIAVSYSLGSDGRPVSASANAAFIVKAVNNHEALVKALDEMVNTFQPFTLKPTGAPNSAIRRGQEHQIDVHKRARQVLGDVGTGKQP